MLRVEREHRFDASVEDGFAYITNPANWPEYWPGFVRMERESKWNAPGDESTIVVKLLGREVELRMVLRRLVANEVVMYESSQPGLPDAHHERHFTPDGGVFDIGSLSNTSPEPASAVFTTGFSCGAGWTEPSDRQSPTLSQSSTRR